MSEANDWTRTFLRWADDRQVTIGFVNYLDEPPMEVWRFNMVDSELGADDVASELLRFTQELEEGANFSLDVKRRYQSWGGDAAAFEVIIMVITGAIKWGDANFAFSQLRRLSAHTPWPPP